MQQFHNILDFPQLPGDPRLHNGGATQCFMYSAEVYNKRGEAKAHTSKYFPVSNRDQDPPALWKPFAFSNFM
jgi:hypothetical protein